MGNPFVHVELHTTDLKTVKQFYSALFDWKLHDIPGFGYTMVNVGEGTAGGMCVDSDHSPAWRPYVQVEDIHAATKKAESLGAKIIKEVTEVPMTGWFSVIADPTGALLGLWQPKGR
ncbi:MAG: VOC family protein [Candidatus Manganitrophus sp.]|nr:VOC family protein [Candidatus Manganitrophus sp.]MDC4225190.1 VOC family protein [Candidatus Manganitrophus sp.]WDT69365.1 MAG: VOC family protein [Candidatus Manganitrophus sp.]WDT79051.1 MAG: VOC family protein [Candidatus Manganitrophus sp.]